MNTELQIILVIIQSNSYSYGLDQKTNLGTITFNKQSLQVKPENFEKAIIIRELMENDNMPLEKILEIKRAFGEII